MKKKTLLIIIIILAIILIGAGVFAYLYLGTDIFRSEKELFAKYTTQVVEENGFFPTILNDYETKKNMVAYESNGTISADTEIIADTSASSSMQEIQSALNYANNTNITFQGKVDKANRKVEENFSVNYTDSVKFPFTYRQDGDRYGLNISEISGTTYVAVENNNLPGLLQSLGATNVTNVPNKLEMPTIESLNLTEEEKTHIKETYITPMYEGISEDKFTKIKNDDGSVSYELNLTPQEAKDMLSQMLQTLSTDTMMIDKLNSIYNEFSAEFNLQQETDLYSSYYSTGSTTTTNTTNPLTAENILELKNELDSETIDGGNIKITVTESRRSTTKLAVELVDSTDTTSNTDTSTTSTLSNDIFKSASSYLTNTNSQSSVEPAQSSNPDTILFELTKAQADEASVSYTINVSYKGEDTNVVYTMDLAYTGLDTNNPTESLNVKTGDPDNVMTTYSLQKNITFGNQVSIDALDDTNTVVLNGRSSSEVLPFLMQYVAKLGEINTNQMTQIGYPTDAVNPLMLWVGGVGMVSYIQASDVITNTSMSQEEKNAFNSQFESYGGTDIRGSRVKTLVDVVRQNNLVATDDTEKLQILTTAGGSTVNTSEVNQSYTTTAYLQQLGSTIQTGRTYSVSFGYDSTTGKITTVYILESTGATGTTTTTGTNTIGGGSTTNTVSQNTLTPQIVY